MDLAGKRTVLSGDYWGEEGLAWSRTGDEILFTASNAGTDQTLHGVDLSGHRRVALTSAGGLTMHDVSRTGRWLVTHDDRRYEISVLAPGASAERDLSWLDTSTDPYLSRDGTMLLFGDESIAAGANYGVCMRRTDGGPVVRLGEGQPSALSPDGKWALAIIYTPSQLLIYPTGPGEPRRLPRGDIETYHSAGWFPDGRTLMARQPDGQTLVFRRMDSRTGEVQATWTIPALPPGAQNQGYSPDLMTMYFWRRDQTVPCEGTKCTHVMLARDLETGRDREVFRFNAIALGYTSISHDGRQIAFTAFQGADHLLMVASTAGGPPREIYRVTDGLSLCCSAWTQDGGHVLAFRGPASRGTIWSFSTNGGPPEKSQLRVRPSETPAVSPDGTQIAFVGGSNSSEIWVMTGLFPGTKPLVGR